MWTLLNYVHTLTTYIWLIYFLLDIVKSLQTRQTSGGTDIVYPSYLSSLPAEYCKTRRRLIALNDVWCQMSADGATHLHPASLSTHPSIDYLSMIATLTVSLSSDQWSSQSQSYKHNPCSVFIFDSGVWTLPPFAPWEDVGGGPLLKTEGQNV